jgi:hypothetical protein
MEALPARRKGRNAVPLTVAQILAWADAHHGRTGQWPTVRSGRVADTAGETWRAVDVALSGGHRALPGGDTLARLLRRERGAPARRGGRRPDPGRRRLAARLRAAGLTLAEVGQRLGVSRQAAFKLVQRARAQGHLAGSDPAAPVP